jgi:hypothetical protein
MVMMNKIIRTTVGADLSALGQCSSIRMIVFICIIGPRSIVHYPQVQELSLPPVKKKRAKYDAPYLPSCYLKLSFY